MAQVKGLLARLDDGEFVIAAEGYVFEFERRGYLKAGPFVPEVVLEHPDLVKAQYEEFVHAGSDVVLAFTYYGHRAKLCVVEKEDEVEKMNRLALRMARQVADDTGTLMAGNICNTGIWAPNDKESEQKVKAIFKEQVQWAVEEGADFIVAETFPYYGEALLALQSVKEYGAGVPVVVTLMAHDGAFDDVRLVEACQRLEQAGADVVGLNCCFGPDTILPLMKELKKTIKVPLACLPSPYRTSPDAPSMLELKDQRTGKKSFPLGLDSWLCSRDHIAEFTREMQELGIQYIGLCCGNRAFYTRTLAETLGREVPASLYSPEMEKHLTALQNKDFGDKSHIKKYEERFGNLWEV